MLYGPRARWAMTERGATAVTRDASTLRIGPSGLAWDGDALTITLDERTAPVPRRLRGTIRVYPGALPARGFALHPDHRWAPIAPVARADVTLDRPEARWSGAAYFDTNDGAVPLESTFRRWDWSRAARPDGASVLYETEQRDGGGVALALRYDGRGGCEPFDPPPRVTLPRTGWGVARATRADDGDASVLRGLEDAPFYQRCVLRTRLHGAPAEAMHESLDCARFAAPWVQAMLPFRMPRALR